jgi:hypothetical protein
MALGGAGSANLMGVDRFFGSEVLRIAPGAIDLSRVLVGAAPLLDAHQASSINNVLGRISENDEDDAAAEVAAIIARAKKRAATARFVAKRARRVRRR